MKIFIFTAAIILSTATISSCDTDVNPPITANAEIIGFNSAKCGCCWGWIIRMGSDTIRADDLPGYERIGMNITKPIPVYIELGDKKVDCSSISGDPVNSKSFYVIKKIELLQ